MANGGEVELRPGSRWRIAGWGIAALVLLLPLVAMRFTSEVNWTVGDFIFAALLIGIVGVTFELTVRVSRNYAYRAGVGFALAASFLLIWVNGAVGMIGSEENPYNLLFLGVILVAMIGAALARFRPAGMVRAMAVAGLAQGAVAAGGLATDLRGGALSLTMAGIWLLSAALFRNAAQGDAPVLTGR